MKNYLVALLFFILQLNINPLSAEINNLENPTDALDSLSFSLCNWKRPIYLRPCEKKPARTAILIIAPPNLGTSFVEQRWTLGQKVWEQYMNSNPHVDCYFLKCAHSKKNSKEKIWLEGNTIYVADSWYETYGNDRLLYKTIKALEWLLPNYTHFIRTNLNTFINLKSVNEYMETHHNSMFTTPLWEQAWFAIGYSVIFTADVAAHMINEYYRLEKAQVEYIDCYHADDCAMTALATGVWPLNKNHPFTCCPTLPYGTRQLMCIDSLKTKRFSKYGLLLTPIRTFDEAINYCNQASNDVMLYRIRDGLNINQLVKLYTHLLNKVYPGLARTPLE